ncbi:8614_t:CDS:2, partial [Racocetra persica]
FSHNRYLTKITTHQLCLMDDSDVENFDWNLLESALLHDFEVKKSQEQKENFELYKGFDLPLLMPSLQSSYTAECSNKPPLYPLVVES